MIGTMVAGILVGVTAALLPAQPQTTIVQGSVIRLESVQDAAAMASMTPGEIAVWDVGVSASADDGMLDVTLASSAEATAFQMSVRSCDGTYASGECTGAETTLLSGATPGGVVDLGAQPSSATVWYRIEVVLVEHVERATAALVLRVDGEGDAVESGGQVSLPETGGDLGWTPWLATVAIGAGLLLAWIAHRGRRRA